jgi:DNA-binding IclR family transcriptional regulator
MRAKTEIETETDEMGLDDRILCLALAGDRPGMTADEIAAALSAPGSAVRATLRDMADETPPTVARAGRRGREVVWCLCDRQTAARDAEEAAGAVCRRWERGDVQAARDIVREFLDRGARGTSWTTQQIARVVDIPRPRVSRALRALELEGCAERIGAGPATGWRYAEPGAPGARRKALTERETRVVGALDAHWTTVADVARDADLSPRAALRQLVQLAAAGLVERSAAGETRGMYRPTPAVGQDSPVRASEGAGVTTTPPAAVRASAGRPGARRGV